ncbi:MAG: class C sortase [Firmicutes bacterium]|nr:class C sortase [Bacillota bacterium]
MKKHWSTILLIVILIIGLSLLLYPTFSDWWNSFHQSKAIASYTEQVAGMDEEKYDEVWSAAREYNSRLLKNPNSFILSDQQWEKYEQLLDVSGSGIMGYVEIPIIDVMLPIYHGTDEAVLQIAVGHLEWSSLPVGGESSHCVVSGHRGLPSAQLFTDLDKMVEGDIFIMHVLDEVLTYQVDQIRIVEPAETEDLLIVEGEDLCTLITCTPYGINSHRMLVRGHRIENIEEINEVHITADAIQIEPMIVAPFVAAPILLVLLIGLLWPKKKTRRSDAEWKEEFPF